MKKLLLALSIALALFVTTGCVQNLSGDDEHVVVTIKNDRAWTYLDVKMYDSETGKQMGDTVDKLKPNKKAQFLAEKNSIVYFKMTDKILKEDHQTLDKEIGEEDIELELGDIWKGLLD